MSQYAVPGTFGSFQIDESGSAGQYTVPGTASLNDTSGITGNFFFMMPQIIRFWQPIAAVSPLAWIIRRRHLLMGPRKT